MKKRKIIVPEIPPEKTEVTIAEVREVREYIAEKTRIYASALSKHVAYNDCLRVIDDLLGGLPAPARVCETCNYRFMDSMCRIIGPIPPTFNMDRDGCSKWVIKGGKREVLESDSL